MARLRLEAAEISHDPYPHLVSFPALPEEDYRRFKAAVPGVEAFDVKGNGTKLELDIVEDGPAFMALPAGAPRGAARTAPAPARHRAGSCRHLRRRRCAKVRVAAGQPLAQDVLAAGWTTTNGRVMGRAPGYRLDPHLDSAHQGMTCLLYLTDAPNAGGWRARVSIGRKSRSRCGPRAPIIPRPRASAPTLVKTIPVRENKFVAFVAGPSALHGFGRDSGKAQGWRFVYQCHVIPKGMRMDLLMPRLPDEQRRRWEKYLQPKG